LDLIANSENVQTALRSKLAAVRESHRQDAYAFDDELQKLTRTVNKLEISEHLVRAKCRDMKHFVESQGRQMLAEKEQKLERLMARHGKLEPVRKKQPVRLKSWIDYGFADAEDERVATDEDYDADED
jgi:exonuclease VII small subunit